MDKAARRGQDSPGTMLRLTRSMRLIRGRDFDAVYGANARTSAGPLVVWAAPNELGHCRLGLAISRRMGTAVRRNRIRRLIRESFRLAQEDLPREPHAYDLVVSVRRHDPLPLAAYRQALVKAAHALHRAWSKKHDST